MLLKRNTNSLCKVHKIKKGKLEKISIFLQYCIIKLFTLVIYVFVSGKPFQPSLMFVVEARSLP
jgi:hypothetical protein